MSNFQGNPGVIVEMNPKFEYNDPKKWIGLNNKPISIKSSSLSVIGEA